MTESTFTFRVSAVDAGLRIDHFLARRLADRYSRSQIKAQLIAGTVLLNGRPTKYHERIRSGDTVWASLAEVPEGPSELLPLAFELDILFEDEDIVLVNKPAGLVVHPAAGHRQDTLVNALLGRYPALSQVNGTEKPGIVHRLDKDTSGVMVVAKTDTAHRSLALQFKNHRIRKVYIAVVQGQVQHDEGIIDAPLGRNPCNRLKMKVLQTQSREAVTQYRVLRRAETYSVVAAFPKTGRTHQIRAHFAHIGHALLGDRSYGKHIHAPLIDRQALHAYRLGLYHPRSKVFMEYRAPVPPDMLSLAGEAVVSAEAQGLLH